MSDLIYDDFPLPVPKKLPRLTRQFSIQRMIAIVDIAGTQESVEQGSKIRVPLLSKEEGSKVIFEKVLLLSEGGSITLGTPYVAGASVEATVVSVGREAKIRVQKAHRRKRYRRVHGHRQPFTEIEVTKISTK